MKRDNAQRWAEEIEFWGNGGSLWYYDYSDHIWIHYDDDDDDELYFMGERNSSYIMEDAHFEARKAFALGEPVEFRRVYNEAWEYVSRPVWVCHYSYRPKLKPEVKELTVAEISAELGYEVKIVKG